MSAKIGRRKSHLPKKRAASRSSWRGRSFRHPKRARKSGWFKHPLMHTMKFLYAKSLIYLHWEITDMDFEGWEKATWRLLENRTPTEADRDYTHAEVRAVMEAAMQALIM